jgi:4-amino-4-deoxy-L-arabinose transferase-like glycosyltransferase
MGLTRPVTFGHSSIDHADGPAPRNFTKPIGFFELLLVILVILAGYLLRSWDLAASPPPGLLYDEAYNINDIESIHNGAITPFFSGNFGRESLFIYLQAAAVSLFGPTYFSLRLASVFLGTLTLSSVYILARRILGHRLAIVVLALLASSLWHVVFSRIGLRAISLPLFECLALYWMWRALKEPVQDASPFLRILINRPSLVITGMLFGISLYTYTAARFLPFVLLLFGVGRAITHRSQARSAITNLVFILIILAITATPLSLYFLSHPQDFFERASQVSIFSGAGSSGSLLDNAWYSVSRTVLAFVSEGDRNWDRNIASRPIFDPIMLAVFVGGFFLSIFHQKKNAVRLVVITFCVMLLPHILTNSYLPNHLRLVGVLPVLYIFPAFAVDYLAARSRNWKRQIRWPTVSIIGLYLVFSFLKTGYDYFGIWTNNPNVISEFGGQSVQATRFALQQLASGFPGPVYLSVPVTASGRSETRISRYIVPESLQPWMNQLHPFDGTVCFVIAPEDVQEMLVVVPQSPGLPQGIKDQLSSVMQTLQENDDFAAWKIAGQWSPKPQETLGFLFGDNIVLDGYDMPKSAYSGEVITPTLFWRITQPADHALGMGVHVVNVKQEAMAKIDSRQMAFDLRSSGERVISWLAPALPDSLPSGKYGIVVTLYPLTDLRPMGVLDRWGKVIGSSVLIGPFKVRGRGDEAVPTMPIRAKFGDNIILRGYTLERPINSVGQIRIMLHWEAIGQPDRDFTVFVHLLDSQQQFITQHDGPPRDGEFPTSMWEAGDTIADEHLVNLDSPLQAGSRIAIGMYDPVTKERLPVRNADGALERDGMLVIDIPGLQ